MSSGAGTGGPGAPGGPSGLRPAAVPAALVAATLVALSPSLWNGFVWDDQVFFVENPHYRGLGWPQVRWMFSNNLLGHYIPLTWLTHGLEYLVWGLDPFGYHLTNLALHAVNALLFYLVAGHLLGRATTLAGPALRVGAGVAALFFALHPLRVEAVAWVTERRDLLAACLFLTTLLLYLRAADAAGSHRRRLLVASLVAYALGGLAKSIVMSLPLVLVLLDLYPLRRLPADPRAWLAPAARQLWREKLPYLALGVATGVTVYTAYARTETIQVLSPGAWLAKAAYALWLPVQKTLAPLGLSPLYELPPRIDPLEPRFLVAALGVLGVTGLALALARAWPAGLAIWVYQGLVLAPVTSFAHVGIQLTADRYSYLATLGWALLVGAGGGMAAGAWQTGGAARRRGGVGLALAAVWLLGLGVLTWRQTRIWRDTGTLWTHALSVTPACAACLRNLGNWDFNRGDTRSALRRYAELAALRPESPMAFGRVGHAYARLGQFPEAIAAYRHELARFPDTIPVHLTLGDTLLRSGRVAEAVPHLRRVTEAWPREPTARASLAQAYLVLGDSRQAREQYEALRTLDPELAGRLRATFGPD